MDAPSRSAAVSTTRSRQRLAARSSPSATCTSTPCARLAAFELVYRVPPPPQDTIPTLALPGLFGLRMPLYDRVDGLAVPWGPRITLGANRLVVDPTITYRSNLGAYDLAASLHATIGGGWSATGFAGKATLSNDRWIQPDLANTLSTLFVGSDYRNYWRSARYEGRVARTWLFTRGEFSGVGWRTHRKRLVGARWRAMEFLQSQRLAPHATRESGRGAGQSVERTCRRERRVGARARSFEAGAEAEVYSMRLPTNASRRRRSSRASPSRRS